MLIMMMLLRRNKKCIVVFLNKFRKKYRKHKPQNIKENKYFTKNNLCKSKNFNNCKWISKNYCQIFKNSFNNISKLRLKIIMIFLC